eukprot:360957-Pelagomonas_calceolata.AAC.1
MPSVSATLKTQNRSWRLPDGLVTRVTREKRPQSRRLTASLTGWLQDSEACAWTDARQSSGSAPVY